MKKIFVLMIFILFSQFVFSIEIEEDAYISALEIYNSGDMEKAKVEFQKFLEKFPGSKYKPQVLLKLAEFENDFDTAIKKYDEIIKNYAGSEVEIEAIFSKARLYWAKEYYDNAIYEFEKIINNFSESIWTEPAIYYLSLCFYSQKKYDEVEKLYFKYKENRTFTAYKTRMDFVYANCLFEMGKFKEAAENYASVIEKTEPSDKNIYLPFVYERLIECFKKIGDNESAEKYEKELTQRFPNYSVKNQKVQNIPSVEVKKTVESEKPKTGQFTVQIGAYTNKKIADMMFKKLQNKNYSVFMKKEGKFIKIQVGRFETEKEAENYAKDFILKEKLNSYLIKEIKE